MERNLLWAAPGSGSGRCRPGAGSSLPAPPRPVPPGDERHHAALVPRSSARTASAGPPRAARCPPCRAGRPRPPWRAELRLAAPLSRSRSGPLPALSRQSTEVNPLPAQLWGFPAVRPPPPAAVDVLRLLGSPPAVRENPGPL